MRGVLGPHGYEIVRFNHMRGKSPASYSMLTARDMIEAIKSIDGPDVEAIVQFGANLPMARLADEAERWLDKPVISVNVATYWHALPHERHRRQALRLHPAVLAVLDRARPASGSTRRCRRGRRCFGTGSEVRPAVGRSRPHPNIP